MRKGDGRLWTAVLRSMLQSDRSETPGTLPCFPSRAFPSPPTQWFIRNPPSPLTHMQTRSPHLHNDSHPLPVLNYHRSPSESAATLPSIFGYHQTSIWAATGAWLHWRAELSGFYETMCICSHTLAHTPLPLMALVQEVLSILKCLSVYKWWCRVDLVEGSVIPQAGHHKCWLDEGGVKCLITKDPLVSSSPPPPDSYTTWPCWKCAQQHLSFSFIDAYGHKQDNGENKVVERGKGQRSPEWDSTTKCFLHSSILFFFFLPIRHWTQIMQCNFIGGPC